MKKKFSSLVIGLILLITVAVPSVVLMVFHTSSMAAGVSFVLLLHMLLLIALRSFGLRTQNFSGGVTLIFIVMCFVMIHGVITFMMHDNFDLDRFLHTYFFLLFFLLGAFIFVKLALKVTMTQADMAVKFVFYILLLSSIAAILNFSPFSSGQSKPVFFFSEPSHFALVFLPFLLYIMITSVSKKLKFFLYISIYTIAFLLESLVLVAGITFIAYLGMPLKRILYFSPLAVLLVVLNAGNLDYYTSRVNLSSDNQNLSALVYLSGWESAYLNLQDTFGLGVGFQQFGVVGSHGDVRDSLGERGFYNLNLMDGGTVASKLIGEFGIFGITLILFYLVYLTKYLSQLRMILLGIMEPQVGINIFFISCFVMFFIDLFFRGAGYFSSSGFIFIASLMWIISVKPPNYLWLNTSVIPKSTS
jgi:hypothetical protein